jgi:hypothetical protein
LGGTYVVVSINVDTHSRRNRSSGATTMMSITHLWRDEALTPPLTGLFVSIPRSYYSPSMLPEKYRHRDISYEQNKDAPVFNQTVSKFLSSEQLFTLYFRDRD